MAKEGRECTKQANTKRADNAPDEERGIRDQNWELRPALR